MTYDPKSAPSSVEDAAFEWAIRLDGGRLTRNERQALQKWLAESPLHGEILTQVQASWLELDHLGSHADKILRDDSGNIITFPGSSGTGPVTTSPHGGASRIARWVSAVAAVLLVAVCVSWLMSAEPDNVLMTEVGEIRTEILADGSEVRLNTDTKLTVDYTDNARRIILERGEAWFTVAKNPNRPFLVHAGHGVIRAVGTSFNVFNRNAKVVVTITEGIVDYVRLADGASLATDAEISEITLPSRERLVQGQRLKIGSVQEMVDDVSAEEIERSLAWNDGMLAFSGETLQQVVEQVNSYTKRRIIVADQRLAQRHIGGRFRVDDIDGIIKALELTLPAKAVNVTPYVVLLTYRDDT